MLFNDNIRNKSTVNIMSEFKNICRQVIKNKQVGFSSSTLSEHMRFNFIQNIDNLILNKLKEEYEDKCCAEGYVMPNSLLVLSRSHVRFPLESTKLHYTVICKFTMTICCPFKDVLLKCSVLKKNKIGLLCKIPGKISPLIIIVPNDLNINNEDFNSKLELIKIDDLIDVRVLGKKFEQSDKKITVIAQMIT
jgi:DNA-directed RNA polymerase subunit E'/Rpb7